MILAVLQARTSSSRLPGKVLRPILGKPMLLRQIERLGRCREFDKLVVATSTSPDDDELAATLAAEGVAVARGSLDDVLDRFMTAARPFKPETVIRLTGDCPLADPALIDTVIRYFRDGGFDYASNVDPPTSPDGLDVEVMTMAALERTHATTTKMSDREHVTLFIRANPSLFRIGNYTSTPDLSQLRWTVDEPADLDFVRSVYAALYPRNPAFGTPDILAFLERNKDVQAVNQGFERNEGLKKSLDAERAQTQDKS